MASFNNIMAFDFGTRSIGVAVGQNITCTAIPLTTLKVCVSGALNWQEIAKRFHEWQPSAVVVGLPLNMDGTEQPLTAQARKFANLIHCQFSVEAVLHDERLSTIEAKASLFARGGFRALKKRNVDAESAVIILESWLKQFF